MSANMSDSEKLDKQRLKNFKNKGRDLEVKPRAVTSSRFTAASREILAKSSAPERSSLATRQKSSDASLYSRVVLINQSDL